jgi:PAS domain S-box-containing protein
MSEGGKRVMEVDDFSGLADCHWPDFWTGDGNPAALAAVEQAKAGGIGRFSGFALTAKGSPRWWDVQVTPIMGSDGRPERLLSISRDITETHRALEALQVSKERFRAAVDAVAGILWTNNAQGEMEGEQPGWAALTGQSFEDYQGFGWSKAVHPDDVQPTIDAWLEAVVEKKAFIFEHRLRRRDGAWRLFAVRAIPAFNSDGSIREWVGVHTDITDHKRVEAELRHSEARFRGVAEAMPGFVWTADQQGQLDYTSPRWHAYSGLDPQASHGQGWASSVCPEDQSVALARWSEAVATRSPYEVEFRLRRSDGVYRWWLARALPAVDEATDQVRWIGVCTEIEDIVAAREALANSRRDLERQIAERTADRDRMWRLSTDVMLVARFDATITAVNPAWTTLLGWQEDELVGKGFLDLVHPEDQARTVAEAGNLSQGITTQRFENRYRHKDGSYIWISWIAVPDENLIHAVGRDVTAEKKAAEALRQTEEQLRQAQKMEAVGQLTGGVAHDFNNLLTIIRSSVEFLQRPGLPENRRRRYMEAISETVTRASKLTSQLLAFARRQALKPEVFDVAERLRSNRDMFRTISGSRIQIAVELGHDPCFVEADVAQFETALVNMAVNARDAMEGEGRLTVQLKEATRIPALRGHEAKDGRFVAVSLTDTGSGIPPDRLAHIFEPFFTTKEVGKGTGLGLSQVFGFAKQSGGDVDVESEVGRGSTFTLYLPQVHPHTAVESTGPGADRTEAAEHGQGRRVLVVEDNLEVGQFSTLLLEDLGYETVWATNADEALKALAEGTRFDVVFSDVVMPGMSGVDLGHEIQRLYPDLPVVLTSGYSHVLAQDGPHGFELLHKPYAAEEVSRVLRQVMHDRQHGNRR